MIQKIKSFISRINPRSPIVITIIFSAILLFLIVVAIANRSAQENQLTSNSLLTPTPTSKFVPKSEYIKGQINVKFKDGLTDAVINGRLLKYNAQIKSTISGINVKVIAVPVGQEAAVRVALVKEGIVKYAELDHIAHGTFVPNDANFPNQYGLNNKGQSIKGHKGKANADIHIEEAWDVTKGSGMNIVILDTGIDLNHPEFSDKVVLQKIFITNSIDDGYGHGTHTAGILAANTNNNQGIAGACPDCKLIVGKVLDDTASGPYSVISQGITWAADNNAKVISMSLGGYDDDSTLRDAVNYAWGKGSVLIAAAGNDSTATKFYPAADSNVISVAATDNNDVKASFSNYGDWVMIAAPGKDIFSTFPTHAYNIQRSISTALNYDYLSGTSMATPMVSGVAALIWTTPYGTSNQAVVDRLFSTVDPITGTGTYWQKGRLNAVAAVGAAVAIPTPTLTPNPTVSPTDFPNPSPSDTPTVTVNPPTSTPEPSQPVPTFVCGGSPFSICTSPTVTQGPVITKIPKNPNLTGVPTPNGPCLNPRDPGFVQKIHTWVSDVRKTIQDFVNSILGNPTAPRPAPPKIVPPCIQH